MFCHLKPLQSWQVIDFSFECLKIQTKNPFDEIISSKFWLKTLKRVHECVRHESILQRIIKRTHIINHIWRGKKLGG
jgi:hypothetical protein